MEILEIMRNRNGKLTEQDFLGNEASDYIHSGLFALILCLGGTGTSTFSAQRCLGKNVPTAYFYQGLYRLDHLASLNSNDNQKVLSLIAKIPSTTLLLSDRLTREFLPNLYSHLKDMENITYEPNKKMAVDKIVKSWSR